MCHYSPIMNLTTTILLSAFLYLLSGCIFLLRLFKPNIITPSRLQGILTGLAAAVPHAIILYQSLWTDTGLNLAFFNAASLITWTIAVLLLLSALNKPVENLGIVLLPLASLVLILLWQYPDMLLIDNASWQLEFHILVSLLAYSLLTLAAAQASLLAIQNKQLKNHRPGGFIRVLPPLQTMEALLFEMIWMGFILLSLSLASGFMFLEDMFAQHLVHKTILSITAWLIFVALLWGRHRFGWRGQTAIKWTLTGFVILMLAYFGSKAVLELILTT